MRYIFVFLSILFYANFAYGYITQNIPNGCHAMNKYMPVFERSTYTCANGYFLPANGTACVACPVDATCSGGTFTLNENIAQGIVINSTVSHNLTNVCSSVRRRFKPVFAPNVITINWYNSDATDVAANNAGTTEYGGNIRTPANPPHMPGYSFLGWKFGNAPSAN